MKKIAEQRNKYFARGKELGTSEDILKFIWDTNIKRQLGYSYETMRLRKVICVE